MVNKGIIIAGERDITYEMLTRNMTRILRALPDGSHEVGNNDDVSNRDHHENSAMGASDDTPAVPDPDENVRSLSDGARDFGAIIQHRDAQSSTSAADECIICFDGRIDCVATPCGHQICCQKCSKHVTRCPVCAQDCSFLRVFKP